MPHNRCITTSRPAWRLHAIRPARSHSARRYSRYGRELLRFLAFHRTATGHQIHRFHVDLLGASRSERSVRMHLQTLVAAGELAILRGRGMNEPNVYLVTGRGLRKAGLDNLAARRQRPTGNHLAHELLITEVATRLRESTRQVPSLQLEWEERFGFHKYDCFREVVPDYAFLFNHGGKRLACLVEVSSGEESGTRLQQKLLAYELWRSTGEAERFLTELYRQHGASQPRPHFRLLCLMHNRLGQSDEVRLRQLLQAAADLSSPMRRRIWCAAAEAFEIAGDFTAPFWLRLVDLETVFEEAGAKRQQLSRRLTAAIKMAPRHSLFLGEAAS